MKDMKNRVWRAISVVAMREHWRVRPGAAAGHGGP